MFSMYVAVEADGLLGVLLRSVFGRRMYWPLVLTCDDETCCWPLVPAQLHANKQVLTTITRR
jgi:hypothetical protein